MDTSQNDIFFDLTEDNIDYLGGSIIYSIEKSKRLICYSKEAIDNPGIPLTKINGLKSLFIKACLQYGLLGYLDWKLNQGPDEQISIILNNIIIIICGNEEKIDGSNISFTIDENKLKFIKDKSSMKFNDLLKQLND